MAKDYDSDAHGGVGRGQNSHAKSSGVGRSKPTRDASRSPEGGKDYETSAHMGSGKAMKLTPPAVGTGYARPTREAGKGPVGSGGAKQYETDAHSNMHHGQGGRAVGAPREAAPMDYDRKTNAEGAKSQPVAGHEGLGGKSGPGLAEHHAGHDGWGGAAHSYPKASGSGGHSFGHPVPLRRGALRLSGHAGAHQIGKK